MAFMRCGSSVTDGIGPEEAGLGTMGRQCGGPKEVHLLLLGGGGRFEAHGR